jgi:pimeloyl-ACP methyl ester carboxylesterase
LGATAFARRRAPRLVHDGKRRTDVVARVTEAMSTVTLPGYGQAVRMLASGDLLGDAAEIEAPTIVVTGDRDVITPPDNARRLSAVLQSLSSGAVELHVIAGAGHAIYLEAPVDVSACLAAFFAGAP